MKNKNKISIGTICFFFIIIIFLNYFIKDLYVLLNNDRNISLSLSHFDKPNTNYHQFIIEIKNDDNKPFAFTIDQLHFKVNQQDKKFKFTPSHSFYKIPPGRSVAFGWAYYLIEEIKEDFSEDSCFYFELFDKKSNAITLEIVDNEIMINAINTECIGPNQ